VRVGWGRPKREQGFLVSFFEKDRLLPS